MKTAIIILLSLLGIAGGARAQSTPFDMSPERGPAVTVPQQPVTPTIPVPQKQGSAPLPQRPVTPTPPSTSENDAPPASSAMTAVSQPRRYVIPTDILNLSGEIDERSWSVYLTPEQAASPARFNLGYQNSVVIAPELSRLSIRINNVSIVDAEVRSSDAPTEQSFEIPGGVLRPGANLLSFQTKQRHRTDCTLESTYELWTRIDPSKTFLSFSVAGVTRPSRLDDIRAIGVDEAGKTKFKLVVPALEQLGTSGLLMRLAQGLGLLSNMPNQTFAFSTAAKDAGDAAAPGQMTIFVGTAAELRPLLGPLPSDASRGAVASFIPYPGAPNETALVLSGPTWQSIDSLVNSLFTSPDGSVSTARNILSTQAWRPLDTVFLSSDSTFSFSQLGVKTQEFSGRLFRTNFAVGIPADFYAKAYGQMQILLDAAYTSQVLPGSHIDVYVNGNIASTMPINTGGGAILHKLPINVTLRHFRPGVNTVVLEAVLRTEEDIACVPGATASDKPRFAIFDTSQFHIPDFARIAQTPNLAAVAGTAFPYGRANEAVPLFLDRIDENTLSAAATFLGKLSEAAHRVIPVDVTVSTAGIINQNALFVGSISQIPPNVLAQFEIADSSRTSWTSSGAGGNAAQNAVLTVDNWGEAFDREGRISRRITAFKNWLKRSFDLSTSSLRFAPSSSDAFTPSNASTFMVAQEGSPNGEGTWTLVTAPSSDRLREGVDELSKGANWSLLDGRIVTYQAAADKFNTVAVTAFRFVPTVPLTLVNMRLIAANWLSDNIMSYSVLLAGVAVLLGFITVMLLSRLGRS